MLGSCMRGPGVSKLRHGQATQRRGHTLDPSGVRCAGCGPADGRLKVTEREVVVSFPHTWPQGPCLANCWSIVRAEPHVGNGAQNYNFPDMLENY